MKKWSLLFFVLCASTQVLTASNNQFFFWNTSGRPAKISLHFSNCGAFVVDGDVQPDETRVVDMGGNCILHRVKAEIAPDPSRPDERRDYIQDFSSSRYCLFERGTIQIYREATPEPSFGMQRN